jgi:hypothetical protein
MGLTGLGTPNYARIDPENCLHADRWYFPIFIGFYFVSRQIHVHMI